MVGTEAPCRASPHSGQSSAGSRGRSCSPRELWFAHLGVAEKMPNFGEIRAIREVGTTARGVNHRGDAGGREDRPPLPNPAPPRKIVNKPVSQTPQFNCDHRHNE